MTAAQQDPGQAATPAGTPKGLLRLVYIMGIVLVLLFLLLIAGLVWKASRPKAPEKPQDVALSLGLKAQDVNSLDLDSGQLAITTPREIIIVDVAKRKVLLRLPLDP